ncbi:hypothetical protein SLEP1_g8405 [Rubroshorea leprosula]|uniref:Reverse transcriptase domain-containing protein n=1 Tax=Rubroshorea leprosula TaxID=152421 RepID=A0AAV5I1H0_9ROSI|nr:hypothetical protein SLEP1_g8405 [Rubroshorea leprosula]
MSVPFYTEESNSNLVDNLDEGVAIHALMNGSKDCDFLHSLNKEEPKSLKDILNRSEGYIQAEESVTTKKGVAKETEHLNWLEKLHNNGNKRDRTRHCAFHGTHGHDTKDYKQLRMEIERLIHKGALRQFIRLPKTQRGARRMERSQDNREVGLSGKSVLIIVVVSTQAMMIKFLTPNGVEMARGKPVEVLELTPQARDQVQTLEPNKVIKKKYKSKHWDLVALGDIVKEKTLIVDSLDMREELKECRTEPIDELKPVILDQRKPERTDNIGVDMDTSFMARLENCLMEHKDIFAWCLADMPGIDPEVVCHRLEVNPDVVPIRQKVRQLRAERSATTLV